MISGSSRFPSGVEASLQPHEPSRLDGFHRRRKLCNAVKRVRCESRMIKSFDRVFKAQVFRSFRTTR
jgi:hypothetical protein